MGFSRFLLQKMMEMTEKADVKRLESIDHRSDVCCKAGIAYLDDGDPMHMLNLYYPQNNSGTIPTIIDIHGGSWMYGDRNLNRPYCEYLAAQGFRVMGMSYRLLPATDLQGIIQDIFSSIHWLEDHAQEYGFDLSHVVLTGDSAGGHLAGLVSCIQNSTHLQKIYDVHPFRFDFSAVAICNGVCEIHDIYPFPAFLRKRIDMEIRRMMLGRRGEHAPWHNSMSFSDVVDRAEKIALMVIGSESDPFYNQTGFLLDTLRENHWSYQELIWEKEKGKHLSHVFQILYPEWEESQITNNKMLDFFRDAIFNRQIIS